MSDIISQLQDLIAPCAAQFETVPEHWIHDWDESLSFCRECAEKKIAELLEAEPDAEYMLDGGWRTKGDSQAFCETCGKALDNAFTDYAVESEIQHFETYGFDTNSPDDCYAVLNVIYALGSSNEEIHQRLEALAQSILAKQEPPVGGKAHEVDSVELRAE